MTDAISPEVETAARHLMDTVNLHVDAVLAGGDREKPAFVAVRLTDGKTPDAGTLYDSRNEASRAHQHDNTVFFVKVGRMSMSFKEAVIVLQMNRKAYRNGVVFREEAPQSLFLDESMARFLPNTMKGLNNRG